MSKRNTKPQPPADAKRPKSLEKRFGNAGKRVAEYVEQHILTGAYPVGEAVPSVRRLAVKFRISYSVVHRALQSLVEPGLLENRPRRGFIVLRRQPREFGENVPEIAVFLKFNVFRWMLIHTMLYGMLDEVRRNGYAFRLHILTPHDQHPAEIEKRSAGAAGAVLLHSMEQTLLPNLKLSCPAVGLLAQDNFNGMLSAVNIDFFEMAEIAAGYFRRAGVKKVAIISSFEETYTNRALAFKSKFEFHGGETGLFIIRPDEEPRIDCEKDDCGYFFTSDSMLQMFSVQYAARHGRRLAEERLVLGVDGKRFYDPDMHIFPTIAYDYREMGRLACEELLLRIRHPERRGRNICCYGELII